MQLPWSRPTWLVLLALNSRFENGNWSPCESPLGGRSTTCSLTGCSTRCSVVRICCDELDPVAAIASPVQPNATPTAMATAIHRLCMTPPFVVVGRTATLPYCHSAPDQA